jgi:hypothetical protein
MPHRHPSRRAVTRSTAFQRLPATARPLRIPIASWGRLLQLADGLYAFDLGQRQRGGRLLRIGPRGTTEIVARGLDLPSDAALVDERLVISEPTRGRIGQVAPRGRRHTVLGGLEFPLALAAPAPGSGWHAPLYVAEAGPVESPTFAPGQGRIRAVDPDTSESSVLVAEIGVVALAASPAGLFANDLVFATANQWRAEREPLPNTGRILRIAPSGTATEVVAAVDEPLDICFGPSGRCFVLGTAGIFEITRR